MLLVKIKKDDYNELVPKEDQVWCLVYSANGGSQNFCEGQFFGYGESAAEYETKEVKKGGITCKRCIEKIKEIKSIKL